AAATIDAPILGVPLLELLAAPESVRGWEWRHLVSNLESYRKIGPLTESTIAVAAGTCTRRVSATFYRDTMDMTTRVLDAGDGRTLWSRAMGPLRPHSAAFLDRDRQLALLAQLQAEPLAAVLLVVDAATGTTLRRQTLHEFSGNPGAFALSAGAERAAVVEDGTAHVFDVESGLQIAELPGIYVSWGVTLDAGGQYLRCKRSAGQRLIHVDSGRDIAEWRSTMTMSRDGSRIVLRDGQTVKVVREDGAELMSVQLETPELAALSSDGAYLAVAERSGFLGFWTVENGQPLGGHERTTSVVGYVGIDGGFQFLASDRLFLTGNAKSPLQVWPVRWRPAMLRGHGAPMQCTAFSPDGRVIATGSPAGGSPAGAALRLWGTWRRDLLASRGAAGESVTAIDWIGGDPLIGVTSLRDGRTVTDVVRLNSSGAAIWCHEVPGGAANSIRVAPSGDRIAIVTKGGIATLLDPQGCELATADIGDRRGDFASETYRAAWSPDSSAVAVTQREMSVGLLSGDDLSVLRMLEAHVWASDLEFSPDGHVLAVADTDATVQIFDADTGRHARAPLEHQEVVRCLAFSPDGTRLATGTDAGAVYLFETQRYANLFRIDRHDGPVIDLSWSPDGETLLSASQDGTVYVWSADDGDGGEPAAVPQDREGMPLLPPR
ncbi:MAG: hypothetical protein AAF628_25230, partial [Planctomycetota bacterium]